MKTLFKKLFFPVTATCLLSIQTFAQQLMWQDSYTTNSNDEGRAVTVGGDGRVYTGGYSSTINGSLIISYNHNGTKNWVRTSSASGAVGNASFYAVSTFGSGASTRIYAAGNYYNGNPTWQDAFIAKYDQSGNMMSGFPIKKNIVGNDLAYFIAIDAAENIYISGICNDYNPSDVFVQKYNSSGVLQWTTTYNSSGTQSDTPTFMKLNSTGTALYISGITTVSSPNTIGFVQKINTSTGAIQWTSTYNGSPDADNFHCLDVLTGRNGTSHIYVVGSTKSASTGLDAVIRKYDDSGNLVSSDIYNNPSLNLDDEFVSVQVQAPSDAIQVFVTGRTANAICGAGEFITRRYNDVPLVSWTTVSVIGFNGCPTSHTGAKMVKISPYSGKIYVTGDTYNSTTGLDVTTFRYNPSNGVQEWGASYDRNNNGYVVNYTADKFPMAIGVTNGCGAEAVYITGMSLETSTPWTYWDCTTIKYDEPGFPGGCKTMGGGGTGTPATGTTDIEDIASGGLYPNPFRTTAILKLPKDGIYTNVSLMIYNATGQVIKHIEHIDSHEIVLDRAAMKKGIYYYRCTQGEDVISSDKFIVAD